jgi:hypothetical protein
MSDNLLNNLKTKKNETISSFNQIALNMIDHLRQHFKDSFFNKKYTTISNFFRFKPKEIIIMFLDNIYSNDDYRKQIKAGNEDFFMSQTYDNLKSEYDSNIFEFKDLWANMNKSTKLIVKESMQMLVDHCELYLEILSQINKMQK